MLYKHEMLLKELYKKIKRPIYSSLAVIKINNLMVQFYTKDTHMGKSVFKKQLQKLTGVSIFL